LVAVERGLTSAVGVAAESLAALLDGVNHVLVMSVLPVVPTAEPGSAVRDIIGEGDRPHRRFQLRSVRPVLQPAISAERIADAGRAAGNVADVIEVNLGVVLLAYQVDVDPGERFYGLWWRDLLLVAETSATVLHMAFSD
jgi:hypothetical protein